MADGAPLTVCGIAGIYRFDDAPVDRENLERMNGLLSHRGPDGSGLWTDRNIGFAHRRLAIIDLQTGDQPMHRSDLGRVVIFNGEIYNYLELRAELEAEGFSFKTASDTEVLLVGHAAWGDAMLARLRGMFAFALWNSQSKELLLARDPLGKKPLYFTERSRKFVAFASEPKALLALPDVPRSAERLALLDYLELMYVPEGKSIWTALRQVAPGTALTVRAGEFKERRFWAPPIEAPQDLTAFDTASAEVERELREATRIRLRSDVPVGIFLSGGIDSTLVALAAAEQSAAPLRTYTVGFPDQPDGDERQFAKAVAERIGSIHTEIDVTLDGPSLTREVAQHFDEPFGDTSAVPTYAMARETKRLATVVLSGDGGDEIFGGYPTYLRHVAALGRNRNEPSLYRRVVAKLMQQAKAGARGLPPIIASSIARVARPHRSRLDSFVDAEFTDPVLRQVHFMRVAHSVTPANLLEPLFQVRPEDPFRRITQSVPRLQSPIRSAMLFDQLVYLPGDILKKVDRATMASGLEVRAPFLDETLLRTAYRMPVEFLVDAQAREVSRRGKRILKNLCSRTMGDDFTFRPKQGFLLPLQSWLDRPAFVEMIELGFCGADSPIRHWFLRGALQKTWSDFRSGKRWLAQEVWNLIMLDGWARHYRPEF